GPAVPHTHLGHLFRPHARALQRLAQRDGPELSRRRLRERPAESADRRPHSTGKDHFICHHGPPVWPDHHSVLENRQAPVSRPRSIRDLLPGAYSCRSLLQVLLAFAIRRPSSSRTSASV